jgi:hypothetical protein
MRKTLGLLVAAALAGASGVAAAADLSYPAPPPSVVPEIPAWTVTLAPYVWAAGLKGDIGVGGRVASVDMSFGDVVSNLQFAFMGVGEIRNGRFAVFTDLTFGQLANSVRAESQTLMWTAGVEYRFVDAPGGHLDAFAGFRVYGLDNSLAFQGGPLNGVNISDNQAWIDPMIGLIGRVDLTDRVFVTAWGMIGGFGVSSDLVWDVMAGLGYEFNQHISAVAGYRASGVNYSNGGFLYDVVQQGPFTGIIFKF